MTEKRKPTYPELRRYVACVCLKDAMEGRPVRAAWKRLAFRKYAREHYANDNLDVAARLAEEYEEYIITGRVSLRSTTRPDLDLAPPSGRAKFERLRRG